MSTLQAIAEKIRAEPNDPVSRDWTSWLVYADMLQELGDEKGEVITHSIAVRAASARSQFEENRPGYDEALFKLKMSKGLRGDREISQEIYDDCKFDVTADAAKIPVTFSLEHGMVNKLLVKSPGRRWLNFQQRLKDFIKKFREHPRAALCGTLLIHSGYPSGIPAEDMLPRALSVLEDEDIVSGHFRHLEIINSSGGSKSRKFTVESASSVNIAQRP